MATTPLKLFSLCFLTTLSIGDALAVSCDIDGISARRQHRRVFFEGVRRGKNTICELMSWDAEAEIGGMPPVSSNGVYKIKSEEQYK